MVTYSALVSQDAQINSVIDLIRSIKTQSEFYKVILVLMENSIVPNIDKLQLKDLYQVLVALTVHKIGKKIYFDLLATEYVRKH